MERFTRAHKTSCRTTHDIQREESKRLTLRPSKSTNIINVSFGQLFLCLRIWLMSPMRPLQCCWHSGQLKRRSSNGLTDCFLLQDTVWAVARGFRERSGCRVFFLWENPLFPLCFGFSFSPFLSLSLCKGGTVAYRACSSLKLWRFYHQGKAAEYYWPCKVCNRIDTP